MLLHLLPVMQAVRQVRRARLILARTHLATLRIRVRIHPLIQPTQAPTLRAIPLIQAPTLVLRRRVIKL